MYISSVMHFLDAVLALLLLITSSVPDPCHIACVASLYLLDYSVCLPLTPAKVSSCWDCCCCSGTVSVPW